MQKCAHTRRKHAQARYVMTFELSEIGKKMTEGSEHTYQIMTLEKIQNLHCKSWLCVTVWNILNCCQLSLGQQKTVLPSPVTKQLKIRRPNLAEPLAQLSASLKKFIIIYAFDMLIL